LIVKKKSNQKQYDLFLDNLTKIPFLELKVSEILDVDDSNYQYSETEIEDTLSILNGYVEESEFQLNKEVVKKIIKDIYDEALEIE
jgi:hypothetical protein